MASAPIDHIAEWKKRLHGDSLACWIPSHIAGHFTDEKIQYLTDGSCNSSFSNLSLPLKTKILLALASIPERNLKHWENDIGFLFNLGMAEDEATWVRPIAEILHTLPAVGHLNTGIELNNKRFGTMLSELRTAASSWRLHSLPMDYEFAQGLPLPAGWSGGVNGSAVRKKRSGGAAVAPYHRYFRLAKKPRSVAALEELLRKAVDIGLTKKKRGVAVKMRSFAKNIFADDEVAVGREQTPKSAGWLTKDAVASGRKEADKRDLVKDPDSSSIGLTSSVSSCSSSRLPGAQIHRKPMSEAQGKRQGLVGGGNSQRMVQLIDIAEQPGFGKYARAKRRQREQEEQERRKAQLEMQRRMQAEEDARRRAELAEEARRQRELDEAERRRADAELAAERAVAEQQQQLHKNREAAAAAAANASTTVLPAIHVVTHRPAAGVNVVTNLNSNLLNYTAGLGANQQPMPSSSMLTDASMGGGGTQVPTQVYLRTESGQLQPFGLRFASATSNNQLQQGNRESVSSTQPLPPASTLTSRLHHQQQQQIITVHPPYSQQQVRLQIQPQVQQQQQQQQRPINVQQIRFAVAQQPQQQQQQQSSLSSNTTELALSLTRTQMLNAQLLFKLSNRMTRPEKALILSFMAGGRDNPSPHLGEVMRILLSEYREHIQDGQTGQARNVVADTFFQMDYKTGTYQTLKRYRDAPPDVLEHLELAPTQQIEIPPTVAGSSQHQQQMRHAQQNPSQLSSSFVQ